MRRLILACAALASITSISQQPEQAPYDSTTSTPRVLTASSLIKFGIPAFGFTGRSSCDSAGDIVFNVGRMGALGPFLRVSSDGGSHIVYSLPSELSGQANVAWATSPGGDFFVLYEDFKEYKLIRFKSDGNVAAISSLDVPQGVDVMHLAVADNETVFAGGYRESADPRLKPRSGFAAIFNRSGKLVRDLNALAPDYKLKAAEQGPVDGDAIAAEDGRFYFLGDQRIVALNQSGEVEKEIPFTKPSPSAHAVQVDFSKGTLSILFHDVHRVGAGKPVNVEVSTILINAQNGEVRGSYVFNPATTQNVLCFDGQGGYALFALEGKMAAKDTVPIR